VLTREDLSGVVTPDPPKRLLIYDLAIPRDVEPEVADVPGVALRDLDTLLPGRAEDRWADDISAIEAVIAAELHEFHVWALTRRVAPVIASLRRHVEAVSAAELQRVAPQLADLTEREHAAVESLTNRLIDKMFHHLVMRLRLAAQTDEALVEAAEFFFLHGEGGLFEDAAERQARDRHNEREPHHS
jgi:glutamyl-tRNA reductase